jgi:hypothetical protein
MPCHTACPSPTSAAAATLEMRPVRLLLDPRDPPFDFSYVSIIELFDANVFCFGCPTGELCVSSNATMGLKFYCEKAKSSAGSMNINIFTALAAAIVVALGLKFHQRS